MLKQLLQRAAFEVVGIVAMAFAVAIAVISAAYGLYAVLRTSFSAAASSGLTSLAAIVLVAVLAFVLVRLAKGRAAPREVKTRRLDPDTVQQALSVGAALSGVLADVVLQQRQDRREDKHRRRDGGKRR